VEPLILEDLPIMPRHQLDSVLRHIQKIVGAPGGEELMDRQLLERFSADRDEAAFATLVRRHGPLVMGACRRLLPQTQDAEDVFQATFLVLARKAGSIHWRDSVENWLYEVACRLARKTKLAVARRQAQERETAAMAKVAPRSEADCRELSSVLDEELQRLPGKYRTPLLLCFLEGQTRDQAARQLGWSLRTLDRRLQQGRDLLRRRLTRRGVTLSAGLLAAGLIQNSACAAVPVALTASTVRAALLFAAQHKAASAAASGVISAEVAALVKGASKTLFITKLKTMTVLLLAAGIVSAAAGVLAQRGPAKQPAPHSQTDSPKSEFKKADAQKVVVKKQVRNDEHGDPLPAEAIARVGTMRFRHGSQVYCVAFSPDGRLIASGSYHGDLCLWDRETGKLVRRFVEPLQDDRIRFVTAVAFSPDGEILASNKGKAALWKVRSGKLLRHLDRTFSICSMAFSPDGKSLALATNDEKGIWLFDPATGKACRAIAGHSGPVTAVAFSKEGKVLASGGTDKTARIWEFAGGREIHRFDHLDRVVSVALAPDGKLLAVQTTKQVFLWEVATGREVHRFQAERQFWSLAFSPDGTRLTSANVVWDATTGKEVCRLDGLPSSGTAFDPQGKTLVPVTGATGGLVTGALAFAPDGKVLATGGYDGIIRLHDPATGKELPQPHESSWNRGMMMVCGFAPDGRWLAVRDNGGIHLCETASGKEIHRLPMMDDHGVSVFPLPVALSPDGRMVIAAGAKAIYQWDTATGNELRRIPCPRKWEELGATAALAFAPDGKTFACANYEPTIRLWDTMTGEQLGQIGGDELGFYQLFFSPDGKMLVSESLNHTMHLWDLAKRKELHSWSLPFGCVQAFSPDGRTVAVGGPLILCDLASGKEIRRFSVNKANYCAFSPDGRLLAVDADPDYYPDRERTIQLLEVASGKVRARFAGHFGFPEPMLFSPDGTMLATGSSDTTALIWDVTGRRSDGRLRTEKLSADGLIALWSDLAADEGQAAHRAIWTLAAAPGQALSLLKEKLPPIQAGISPRINELIEALDSNQYAVREKVTGELEELGDSAEPALQKTLSGNPTLEARRRIEQLLRKPDTSPQFLQKLRAVEVLEHIATSEARELLRSLAKGDPEARVTQEAKASLERLARRLGHAGVLATP
jgi:RNA polymerase sigma factor (sigma-70 family)